MSTVFGAKISMKNTKNEFDWRWDQFNKLDRGESSDNSLDNSEGEFLVQFRGI